MLYFCLIINLRKPRWLSRAQRKWKRNWRAEMPKLGEAECTRTPAVLWFLLPYASNGFTKRFPVCFATRDGGLCWTFETKKSLRVCSADCASEVEVLEPPCPQHTPPWDALAGPGCSPRWWCGAKAVPAWLEMPMPMKHLVCSTLLQSKRATHSSAFWMAAALGTERHSLTFSSEQVFSLKVCSF